ncbi:MAG: AmmeMemoRadiSam system protein B [Verrucomicrobiae bacterium]|nr:AmmeMemoRadiSam system protein B [Verrucomicrobiae bacterium]
MAEEFPQLRHIEAFPVQHGEQKVICLRDPLHWTNSVLTVSMAAIPILQCCDGKHSLKDIQDKFHHQTKQTLPLEQLQKFIAKLDEAFMLASPRFQSHKNNLIRTYRESPTRPASHAGASYPSDPVAIGKMFDSHFTASKGPGTNGHRATKPPTAIVSPHIDLRRGGPGFAWAYQQLLDAPKVDTFVILGVAHTPTRHRFAGTKKHYETPLGVAKSNLAFIQSLAGKLDFNLFEDEFAHRSEHSIEFQVVYLQHALRNKYPFEVVPILVGSFHDLVDSGEEPIRDPQVAAFSSALRETIAESGKTVCVVAGVDLAHVGGRFGDEFTVNEDVRKQLEHDDREMLKTLEECNASKFFSHIHEEKDSRRICGFPTLYTMVSALDLKKGEVLYYDQSFEKDTNSVVSFASMSFH